MIIIFEGQDRVGKDTQISLVKKYCYELDGRIFTTLHHGKVDFVDKQNVIEYSSKLYRNMFDLVLNNPSENFIINRSHLGELVYGPLFRKYDGSYVLDIEKEYVNHPVWNQIQLITLVNSAVHLFNREDGDSLSKGDANLIDVEKKLFEDATNASNIEYRFLINCKNGGITDIHEQIIDFLK